ncbi:hypothetical protein KC930_00535 [Candidatus Saccharibacteria bacterium]|nr:hypothetical protein [Candidatus Saccharibacteria bacterium]
MAETWAFILGASFGFFTCMWQKSDVWMSMLYESYVLFSGKLHKYIELIEQPIGFEIFMDYKELDISYADYLRAYEAKKDSIREICKNRLKHFGMLYLKSYWMYFVFGFIIGGIVAPHLYILGFLAYVLLCYIEHHFRFSRKVQPSFVIQLLQSQMIKDYYKEIGKELPLIEEKDQISENTA